MTTGEKIRAARKAAGLTQKKLGEKCQMPDSQIRQYELGMVSPKMETLRRIATALGVGLDAFIDLDLDGGDELARSTMEMRDQLLGGTPRTRQEAEDWKENILVGNYRKLNTIGRNKLLEDSEDYTYIEKYTEPDKKGLLQND